MQMCASFVTRPIRRQAGRGVATAAIPVLLLATLAACSGSDDVATGAISPESTAVETPATAGSDPDFIPSPSDGSDDDAAAGSPTTEFDLDTQPTTPPIEPVPETGVPGIDSTDSFCRAWSEFAGSFQALALVSAIGDADNAYRLEVIASSTVTAAVDAMEVHLPTELESERVALVAELAGPMYGRALLAQVDLMSAGVDPVELRPIWLAALAEAGVDDPEFTVDVPATIDGAALDAAVASFTAASLAIVADPALVTDASVPLTDAYLADVCPDGGTLGGNDDVAG